MKLKAFNTETANSYGKSDVPYINVNTAGTISFSKAASEILKIKDGTGLAFYQNEDSPEDWYLHIAEEDKYFKARERGDSGQYIVQNSTTAQALYNTAKPPVWEKKSMRLLIKDNPIELDGQKYYLIITKPLGS